MLPTHTSAGIDLDTTRCAANIFEFPLSDDPVGYLDDFEVLLTLDLAPNKNTAVMVYETYNQLG